MHKANKEQAETGVQPRPVYTSAAALQDSPFFPIQASSPVQPASPALVPALPKTWEAEVSTLTVSSLVDKIQSTTKSGVNMKMNNCIYISHDI